MVDKGILQEIIRDSHYTLSLFDNAEIQRLLNRITIEEKPKKKYKTTCLIRNREVVLKPEEIIRQLYLDKLINTYGYPENRIRVELSVHFGKQVKSADIAILDKNQPDAVYILVELKKPKLLEGKSQLKSYTNATGSPIAVWTNGTQISYYHRKDPNYFQEITDIPKATQTLKEILQERFTLKDLITKDKILVENKTLKQIIEEMEDEVLANAGVDVFEECFKLIFTKLYDESQSKKDKERINLHIEEIVGVTSLEKLDYKEYIEHVKKVNDKNFRQLEFRNSGETESELKAKIQELFDKAKKQWTGVFSSDAKISLSPSHLSICVASLQDMKLFNSNLQIIDEAFEYLVNKSAKGEKGQYFTPRHVIDMCVKMLNPQRGEWMIDTASGSCGFPVHTIFKITGKLFSNADIPEKDKDDVLKIFGIDFDEKVVRVARTLNLIAGDGETNVLHLNSLDYERWKDTFSQREWLDTYGKGLKRLEEKQKSKDNYKEFSFDILMANPPFAGDIKESRIIHKYELGFNEKRKEKDKVGRDILYIERNLDFIRPGGRLAIVLPQGRFNNTSDKQIRDYISERARILAVVGLHGNTFKPHTGTKTSILFLQKWHDDKSEPHYYCPKVKDYPIFFGVSEKGGKDNSGDYTYLKNPDGSLKLDRNGHYVIDHDLHNQGGELQDGIAEAFAEWAKKEKLSFWKFK